MHHPELLVIRDCEVDILSIGIRSYSFSSCVIMSSRSFLGGLWPGSGSQDCSRFSRPCVDAVIMQQGLLQPAYARGRFWDRRGLPILERFSRQVSQKEPIMK